MVDLGIKQAVKYWMTSAWKNWVCDSIANATVKYENQVKSTVSPHIAKAKKTAYKPVNYYNNQDAFYRGLFWIAIGCLIVLWIISGS